MQQLTIGLGLTAIVWACHADAMYFHSCSQNLWQSGDWDTWQLELVHMEPRTCPVEVFVPGDYLWTSASVFDAGTRDFESSRLIVSTSNGLEINNQVDYFEVDSNGDWSSTAYMNYPVGQGSNECWDIWTYKMNSRHPLSPGSLPSSFADFTYHYNASYAPNCPGDA